MNEPIFESRKILEVGGGEKPLFHPNMDIREIPGVDIVADLNKEWPIPSESYAGVYSSYVIEHISWRKVPHFVSEAYRVLEFGGRIVFITANLKAQAERLTSKEDFLDEDISMIYGDQNYEGEDWRTNSHACGFSPESAQRIFQAAGFSDVLTYVHPNCQTDMFIEAIKSTPRKSDGSAPAEAYNKEYFHGGAGGYGGYTKEGYRDFLTNWDIYKDVMALKPKSVLEAGCARGYLLKRFQDLKIPVMGLEISRHCMMTRAIDGIVEWDIAQTPWPIKDRSFDIGLSVSTLEHISEFKIDAVIEEIKRTCARSFHVINFGDKDDGFDRTHVLLRPAEWWKQRFGDGDHIVHSEQDYSKYKIANVPTGAGEVKLNLGSFTVMFHHGWTNIDILDLSKFAQDNAYRFVRSDLSGGFPGAPSSTVELIYSSHLIEHLDYASGLSLMKECCRVLKPGGVIRISCPDAAKIIRMYNEGRMSEYEEVNEGCRKSMTALQKFHSLLYENHKTIYDEEYLAQLLRKAGFVKIKRRAFRESASEKMLRETLDMFPCLSLYMEASKD